MLKRVLAIALVLMVSLVAVFISQRQIGLTLVAEGPVAVYQTEVASKTPSLAPLRTLSISERVEVIQCIDAKHYMIYKVRFPDGSTGFINDGRYILEGPNGRVAASCQ